ncbi:hypothetical protein Gohar_010371 [Gossypium harknessii]|uniref:Uncharacterized protein n=1 Tax=Gossypium harknessii TaxID=34285 RepID=A0A7J9GRE3_9ROSI|nr:hypothetical protein [Gossypium harknessii]
MKRYVSGQKVGIFFPYLVMALYKSTEVPVEENEQFMHPAKSLIDLLDLMQTHHGEEEQESEEGGDNEEKREEAEEEEIASEEEDKD